MESPLWLCRVYNAEIINGWTGVTETEVFLFFFALVLLLVEREVLAVNIEIQRDVC